MRHLEGAYALIFKSCHYPNELIACKRGSPLLLGVKVSYQKCINYGVAYLKSLLSLISLFHLNNVLQIDFLHIFCFLE